MSTCVRNCFCFNRNSETSTSIQWSSGCVFNGWSSGQDVQIGTWTVPYSSHLSYLLWSLLSDIPGYTIWLWTNTFRYNFLGMNIHLPAILMFTRCQGFDPSPSTHLPVWSTPHLRWRWSVPGRWPSTARRCWTPPWRTWRSGWSNFQRSWRWGNQSCRSPCTSGRPGSRGVGKGAYRWCWMAERNRM